LRPWLPRVLRSQRAPGLARRHDVARKNGKLETQFLGDLEGLELRVQVRERE